MSPTPNTTFVRAAARLGHFTHFIARSRSSAIAASFAARSEVEAGAGIATGATGADTIGRGAGVGGDTVRAAGEGVLSTLANAAPKDGLVGAASDAITSADT